MKMISRIILLGAFLAATVAAHAVGIVHVWPEWRSSDSFVRISELFDGKENPGTEIILRTHPESRDGMYFLVRIAEGSAADLRFEVSVIMPGSPDPVRFSFPAALREGSSVFQLGLTGADWPDAKVNPVAWHVALLGADNAEIAAAQSFLWSAPK